MIKRQKILMQIVICLGAASVFAFFMAFISPRILFLGKFNSAQYMNLSITKFESLTEMTLMHRAFIATGVFILVSVLTGILTTYTYKKIEDKEFNKVRTKLFVDFLNKLKISNTGEGFMDAIQNDLEYKANCEVLFVDPKTDHVIYNSSSRFISEPKTLDNLTEKFKGVEKSGFYFFDDDFNIVKKQKTAKGFAIITESTWLFIICRFLHNVEKEIFPAIYTEIISYEKKEATLSKLLEFAELAKEWNMIAETQRSFLPKKIPDIKGLDIGAYYRPLVNVSGDYYDFVEVSETKTLFVVGDISGKGLPAALIMGVVVNTIRIAEDKEDIAALLYSVHDAIRRMGLVDKYTVMFMGLIDTEKMTIRYVNASLESPLVLTESMDGYKIKTLDSNCSIVGIIDLDDVEVQEVSLYRGDVLVMLTDGVPEVMNENGVELGETEFYLESVKQYAKQSAGELVEDIAGMAFAYSVGRKVRDDLTIVAVKLEG
ncbi:MAG: sigma factor SigB regulation protein [Treponema sp.]|nr:MAG: sigma factor SigB regulation protein [Treponema sp.]